MSIEAARMAVLNLLADQRLGPEEARTLLEALDANPGPPASPPEPARPALEANPGAPASPLEPARPVEPPMPPAVLQRDRGVLELLWLGRDGDQVGPYDQGRPDGQNDGHFRLTLELPTQSRVDWIELRAATAGGLPTGQLWHTADRHGWILAVICRGRRLNDGYQRPLGVFSGRTAFDLYGADAGGFQPGEHFLVRAQVGGRQILEAVTRIEQAAMKEPTTDWGEAYSRRPEGSPSVHRPDPPAGGAPGVSVSTIPGSRLSSPRYLDPAPEAGAPTVPGVSVVQSPTRPRQAGPEVASPSQQPERERRRLEVGVTGRAWPTGAVRAASGGTIDGPAPASSSPVLPSSPESPASSSPRAPAPASSRPPVPSSPRAPAPSSSRPPVSSSPRAPAPSSSRPPVPSSESGSSAEPPEEHEPDRFRVIDF